MPSGRDLEDARGEARDEPAVVGDEDQRAVVLLEPRDQRLDRLEVEVVGGLVEHQHVGLLDAEPREHQPRRLAARERSRASCARRRRRTARRRAARARSRSARPGRSSTASSPPSRRSRRAARGGPARSSRGRSRSPTRPCPRRRRSSPMRILSSVDLPMPLGPMIARRSPRCTVSATSSSTCAAPKLLQIPSASTATLPAGAALREAEGGVAPRALRQPLDHDAVEHLVLALRLPRLGRLGLEALDELARCAVDLLLAARDLVLLALALLVLLARRSRCSCRGTGGWSRSRRRGCSVQTLSRKRWSCEMTTAQPL